MTKKYVVTQDTPATVVFPHKGKYAVAMTKLPKGAYLMESDFIEIENKGKPTEFYRFKFLEEGQTVGIPSYSLKVEQNN